MMCEKYSTLLKPLSKKSEEILKNGYIYIIYPLNYNVNDIDTRLFYIGSAEDFEKRKKQHYQDLYNTSNKSKRLILMRKYMKGDNKINIDTILDDDKIKPDDKKCWQIKQLFHGVNCCTKSYLEALEGLYIYYYYSILNDEEIYFDPERITQLQYKYFQYLDICNHLSKCYTPFEYNDLLYDINPYTLIKKDAKLGEIIHIYKEICQRVSIPKFKSLDKLNFQYFKQKTVDDFYNEFRDITPIINEDNYKEFKGCKNKYFIEIIPDKEYKCYYCEQRYTKVHWWLCDHLKNKHDIIITVKEARQYLQS